jgi:hypothetical protein
MKKGTITYSLLSIVIALAFIACKKDKPINVYEGYDYFPNRVGHWVIYNVDSMYFSGFKWDTSIYQIREVIDSFYTDNTGRRTQVVNRYKRMGDTGIWVYQKSWTANLTPTEALKKEDNITYAKLIFPVSTTSTWNGNAFNTSPDWEYSYTTVNSPLTVGGTYFDSTLTVLQYADDNSIWHKYYIEQYATNVGLIYKQETSIVANNIVFGIPDSLTIPSDFIYLLNEGRIDETNTFNYTETYVTSGN